jgi:hypothetical protein
MDLHVNVVQRINHCDKQRLDESLPNKPVDEILVLLLQLFAVLTK